jgi:prepilin-type N-terminal cleavage/methylation domain-containing protein
MPLFKRLQQQHPNSRGLSLIEVLASLAIFGLVAIAGYSLLIIGLSMHEKINYETQLRNQSNLFFTYILEQLDDAIYIDSAASSCQANAPHNCQLYYVKPDENEYIQQYEMELDNANQTIRFTDSETGTVTKSYTMDRDDFKFQGAFDQISTNQVGLTLTFGNSSTTKDPDKQEEITLQSTIKLFHNR